jgi:hypothetical protein
MSLRELFLPQRQDVRVSKGEQILFSRARLGKTPRLSVYYQPACIFQESESVLLKRWRFWMRAKSHEITIHLHDLTQLFAAPSGDPFSGEPSLVSGIEWILDELTPHALGWGTRIKTTIILPKGNLDPGLARKTNEAVKRYCQFKIRQNRHALVALRWQGVKALQMGIVFLAVCLFLSAILSRIAIVPGFLGTLFSNGLEIAGWVSLWRPIEIFLYEWWPYWRENQLYAQVMNMQIVIKEEIEIGHRTLL